MIKPVLFHSAHALLLPRCKAIDGPNERTNGRARSLMLAVLRESRKKIVILSETEREPSCCGVAFERRGAFFGRLSQLVTAPCPAIIASADRLIYRSRIFAFLGSEQLLVRQARGSEQVPFIYFYFFGRQAARARPKLVPSDEFYASTKHRLPLDKHFVTRL